MKELEIKKLYLKPRAINTIDLVRRPYYFEVIKELLLSNRAVSSLDIGFGDGFYLHYMSGISRLVVGIEISPELIKRIRRAYPKGGINCILADAENLPFKEATFELILCTEVVEHLPHPEKTCLEIHRTTKPRGMVLLTVPNLFNFSSIWASLRKLGFNPSVIGKHLSKILGVDPESIEIDATFHIQKKTPADWKKIIENVGLHVIKMQAIMLAPHFVGFSRNANKIYGIPWVYKLIRKIERMIGCLFPFNMLGQGVLFFCRTRDA